MATTAKTNLITLGLSQIMVGTAAPNGTMPTALTKIGKTYKDTCKLALEKPEVTEHYEEGKASPEVRKKKKKMPVITFSLMDASVQDLVDYIGGTNAGTDAAPKWGYDGTEVTANKAIKVVTEQGLDFEIPNADIEASIAADLNGSGLFLVEMTVTPMAVSAGKPFIGVPHV